LLLCLSLDLVALLVGDGVQGKPNSKNSKHWLLTFLRRLSIIVKMATIWTNNGSKGKLKTYFCLFGGFV